MFEAICSEQLGQREKTILGPMVLSRVLRSVSFGLYSVAGVLVSTVWQVVWTLQCGRCFGLYSVAGVLDSRVWQVFWTL